MARRGRPLQTDPSQQLQRVMHLFWRKGYYDTSVADLVAETGISRAAVCEGYGGKKALFDKSLEFYEAEVTSGFLAVIEEDAAGLPEIESFFRQFYAFLDQPIGHHGCLLCNTSSEVAPDDPVIAARVSRYLSRLRLALSRAAERSRQDFCDEISVDVFADYCVGSVLGLMSMARSPVPRSVIRNYLDGILNSIVVMTRRKSGSAFSVEVPA